MKGWLLAAFLWPSIALAGLVGLDGQPLPQPILALTAASTDPLVPEGTVEVYYLNRTLLVLPTEIGFQEAISLYSLALSSCWQRAKYPVRRVVFATYLLLDLEVCDDPTASVVEGSEPEEAP